MLAKVAFLKILFIPQVVVIIFVLWTILKIFEKWPYLGEGKLMTALHVIKELHKNQDFLLQKTTMDEKGKWCNSENKASDIRLPLFWDLMWILRWFRLHVIDIYPPGIFNMCKSV